MATTGTAFNSVTKAVSGNAYKKRNAATILGAGNFTSGNITNSLTLAQNAYKTRKNGYPLVSSTWGRDKALSSGTFAYMAATKYIMLGNAVTLTISGVSNTTLKSGGADFFRKPIPFKTTARTAFLSGLSWTATELEGPVFSFTVSASNPSFGNDVAAALSSSSRSAAFYMVSGITATKTNYKTLTLW